MDILDKIDFGQLLIDIGFSDVSPEARSYLGYCVFHNDQNTKSFSADLESKLFRCFGCGIRGNAVQLLAKWRGVDYKEAVKTIDQQQDIRSVDRLESMLSPHNVTPSWKRLEILSNYVASLPLVSSTSLLKQLTVRGISKQTLDKFGVRAHISWENHSYSLDELTEIGIVDNFDSRIYDRFSSHPILFPYWFESSVTYLQGRIVGDDPTKPKYLGTRGSIPHAYNHDILSRFEEIYVCEGAIDTLSMTELGYENVIGVPGVDGFKLDWIDSTKHKKVILALDNDTAGQEGGERLRRSLESKEIVVERFDFPAQFKDINKYLVSRLSIM